MRFNRKMLAAAACGIALTACSLLHNNVAKQSRVPLNILVIGDSVTWGQGLEARHKFPELVAAALSRSLSRQVVIKDTLAHSGAIIGVGNDGKPDQMASEDHELPAFFPSVMDQVVQAKNTENDYDFIIVDGCINDIGVGQILNPLPWAGDVTGSTKEMCYCRMLNLLRQIKAYLVSSRTQVVVTAYYPILSLASGSRLPAAHEMLESFLATLTESQRRQVQRADTSRRRFASLNLRRNMMDRALKFAMNSTNWILRAVKDANKGSVRTVFVPAVPVIDAEESAYAGDSHTDTWIWEVMSKGVMRPLDEMQPQPRISDCDIEFAHSNDSVGKAFCKVASIGHPNRCGAVAYADAVIAALHYKWVKPSYRTCG